MDSGEFPLSDKLKKMAKPLSAEEMKRSENSAAVVSSSAEALKAREDKDIQFPILVIPDGQNDSDAIYHVTNDVDELEKAVNTALEESVAGNVSLVSRHPNKMDSGRQQLRLGNPEEFLPADQ